MSTIAEDVNLLGRVLGGVLREQRGQRFFELVEEVRVGTKERRQRDADPGPLQARLASVDLEDAEGLVRAFSMYFQLVNMAEEHERVRRVAVAPGPRSEGIEDALRTLAERGVSADEARVLIEQ